MDNIRWITNSRKIGPMSLHVNSILVRPSKCLNLMDVHSRMSYPEHLLVSWNSWNVHSLVMRVLKCSIVQMCSQRTRFPCFRLEFFPHRFSTMTGNRTGNNKQSILIERRYFFFVLFQFYCLLHSLLHSLLRHCQIKQNCLFWKCATFQNCKMPSDRITLETTTTH